MKIKTKTDCRSRVSVLRESQPVFLNNLVVGEAQNAVFLSHPYECFKCTVKVMYFVAGRNLCAYPCLAVWHNRKKKPIA